VRCVPEGFEDGDEKRIECLGLPGSARSWGACRVGSVKSPAHHVVAVNDVIAREEPADTDFEPAERRNSPVIGSIVASVTRDGGVFGD